MTAGSDPPQPGAAGASADVPGRAAGDPPPSDAPKPHPPGARDRGDRYRTFVTSETYRRQRPQKARVIARICGRELRAAHRVADLGAGTGIVKKELETIVDKPIAGFELARSFIEIEERMAVADVTRLPVADDGLDFAVLNHIYEHVDDQRGLFGELHRVLEPGGAAYVSAGSRWAVMEPHYRLPFLSWLPRRAADAYLRLTGRGDAYRGIRFLGYGPLTRMMRDAGFRIEDRTLGAIDDLIDDTWGEGWARMWAALRALPERVVEGLLRRLSPQWFFVLHKAPDGTARPGPDRTGGGGGRS